MYLGAKRRYINTLPFLSFLQSSVSSCNVTIHQRCSRPPVGATVGLFDWCSALEEYDLAVSILTGVAS